MNMIYHVCPYMDYLCAHGYLIRYFRVRYEYFYTHSVCVSWERITGGMNASTMLTNGCNLCMSDSVS